jgi:hypothetical protein
MEPTAPTLPERGDEMPMLKKKRNAKPRPSPELTADQLKWRDDVFAVYCLPAPSVRSTSTRRLKTSYSQLACHKTTLLRWSSQFDWVKRCAKFDRRRRPCCTSCPMARRRRGDDAGEDRDATP